MAHYGQFRRIVFVILVSISLTRGANSAIDRPILLWTQKSHIWSKLRGLPGDPSKWMTMGIKPYIQSDSSKDVYKYALGFDPKSSIIYWSDRKSFTINKQHISDSIVSKTNKGITTIFKDEDSEIHGIAVDWITGNTYFTEVQNKWIAVVSSNASSPTAGDNYKILFSSNLAAPSGIAVDSVKGLLFWSDSPGAANSKPKIERSTTDGRERVVLVNETDMGMPLGVAVNPTEERVYWVDRDLGRVESVAYDGRDRRRVVDNGRGMSFRGLALYSDYIFVTTEGHLSVNVYEKSDGRMLKQVDIDATPYYPVIIDHFEEDFNPACENKNCLELTLNTGQRNCECDCKQGSYLQLDGKSCGSSKPKYIYSIGRAVMSADVTIKDKTPHILSGFQNEVVTGMSRVQAIGFHWSKDLIYFSDTLRDTIYKSSSTGLNRKELTVQTSEVEGIAIDWTSNQVYWSDSEFKHIMVCKLSGHFHRILVEKELAETPKGIAVDAANRFMFWVSGEPMKGVIKRSTLDGNDVKNIVTLSSDSAPQGIVADVRLKRIYWVDMENEVIKSVDLDGNDQTTVTKAPEYGLYDVTIFQDYTTWTEGDKGLQFGMTRSGEKLQGTWLNGSRTYTESYDVVAFDIYLQPPTSNDCLKNNGGCSQLCYPVGDRARCGCGIGFSLSADDKKCDSNVTKTQFAFFVDPYHKQIYQVTHGAPSAPQGVPLHTLEFPTSVDYDSAGERFYWIDRDKGAIRGGGITGDNTENILTKTADSVPEKLSVDPVNRHLYYTDSLKQAILRMDLPGGKNHRQVVGNIPKASVFTVDYKGGALYWFNVDKIESSSLDGGERETVVTNVQNISSITFYNADQMLYFSDRVKGEIRALNVSTGDETVLIDGSVRTRPIHAIAASQDFIYFSVWNKKAVYRIDRQTGEDEIVIYRPIFARITDLRSIDDRLPVVGPTGLDPNYIIIIGAIAGALLFLLLLLAIIFGARRGCKKRKDSQPEAGPNDDSFDPPDLLNGNGHMSNGGAFQSHMNAPISNINGPMVNGKGHLSNGDAFQSGMDGSMSNINGEIPNGPHAHRPYDDPSLDAYTNIGYVDHEASNLVSSSHDGVTVVPVIPPPPVLAGPPPPVERKAKLRNKPQLPPKPPKSNFQFATKAAQDTMIQRLANRLRKGISSVRWSRGESGDPSGDHGDNMHHGNTAKDKANRKKRSSRLEALINKGGDGTGQDYVEPAKPQEKPPRKKGDIPLNRHQMPRGFAPASHCVPVIVRTTWGDNKVKTDADK